MWTADARAWSSSAPAWPADIAWPIRGLVRDQRNTRVLLGAVTGIDGVRKRVVMADRNIPYDVLVLATGATHGYLGHDSWAAHAPGLKTIDDATEIRRRLLLAFERAEMASDVRKRERFLIASGLTSPNFPLFMRPAAQGRDDQQCPGFPESVPTAQESPRIRFTRRRSP